MINKDKLKGFVSGIILASLFGTTVFAAPIEKQITAIYDNVKLYIDGELVHPKDANGNEVQPVIINNTTYVPIRAVGQAFSKEVAWDENNNSIYIGTKPKLNDLGIKILQKDKTYDVLKQNEEITLNKEQFSISFNLNKRDSINKKFYSAEIASVPSKSRFIQEIEGYSADKSDIFSGGKGLAAYPYKPYDTMFIAENGFHYIYYENESNRRANLIKENEDGTVNVEWPIDNVTLLDSKKVNYKISGIPFNHIYLVIFIDKNLNNVIDEGEFSKIDITLN